MYKTYYFIVDVCCLQELRNTVGNIPLHWYDDYPHIGYDQDGKKILKPAKGDEVRLLVSCLFIHF